MANFCYLAEDVLIEIFLLLPLNLIFKFRCVSKSWLSLLSNPSFLDLIFDKLKKDGITRWGLVRRHSFNDYKGKFDGAIHKSSFFSTSSINLYHEFFSVGNWFSFDFVLDSNMHNKHDQRDIFPLASSNGLVLCSTKEYTPRDYFICNPFTRQFVSLPVPRPDYETEGVTGFVFESSTETYKVIHIPFCHLSTYFDLQIFSSDKSEWSNRQVTWSWEVEMHIDHHIHVVNHGNVWYWMDHGGDVLIAYNDNENNDGDAVECRLLNFPVNDDYGVMHQQCLGESNGLLFYGQIEIVVDVSTIRVWMFQDGFSDTSCWKLMFQDNFSEIQNYLCASPGTICYFVGFSPVDQDVLIFECRGDDHDYEVTFNIRTRKYEVLRSSHLDVSDCYYKGYLRSRNVVTVLPTEIPTKLKANLS